VQLHREADRRMVAAAGGIGLQAVLLDAPGPAEPFGEALGPRLAARVQREESRPALERLARAAQAVGGEEGGGDSVARREPGPEALADHAVVGALHRAAGLVERDAEGVAQRFRLKIQYSPRRDTGRER